MSTRPLRIAVVGAGIAGLGAAWALARRQQVTLFEAGTYLGGHSNTVAIEYDRRRVAVDTGFIVFNEVNYPHLVRLFDHLGVPNEPSNMSFSVSLDDGRFEYASGLPWGPIAQPGNLLRPHFLRMLWEIPKFYRSVRTLYPNLDPATTLGDLLARGRYGSTYRQLHILPMASAIWSTPFESILRFPARDFVRFYEEHGLLRFTRRPRWRTVTGGSREYVRRLMADCALDERRATRVHRVRRSTAGVAVTSERGEESFDVAVLAVHGSDALALIADPRPGELDVLAAFRSSPSRALLHRDPSFMPRRRAAWSSWNYHARTGQPADRQVPVTYWMNRLQNIDPTQPLFVSLNPWREPAPESVFGEFHYRHPTFTPETTRAARCLASIQGRHGLWFCGAYTRYGFHEDGLRSGFAVAAALGSPPPWGMLGVAPADSEAPAPEVRLATV